MSTQRGLTVSVFVLLSAAAAPRALARPTLDGGALADIAVGVTIPVAEDNYTQLTNPSVKASLRFGWVLRLHRWLHVAPEISAHVTPITPDKSFLGIVSSNFTRFGALGGARAIVPVHPRVAVFARFGAGFDFALLRIKSSFGGGSDRNSTAFAMEPGLGAEVTIIPHLVAGITGGVPIAFHDFSGTKVTFVDIDVMAFVGYRMGGPLKTAFSTPPSSQPDGERLPAHDEE